MSKRDPKLPPKHYRAVQPARGVEEGTEILDVVAAFLGREKAIDFLHVEMVMKALRLGSRPDSIDEDLFKIEQAAHKMRDLRQPGPPHSKSCV